MKKLTVGLFLEHYDPFISGVITSVKALRAELEKRGHSVYIICPSVKGYRDNDPHVIRVPSIDIKALDNTTIGTPGYLTYKKVSRIDFDVIHSQEVYFMTALGLQIARKQKIPFIQSFHTLWNQFADQITQPPSVYVMWVLSMIFIYPAVFDVQRTVKLFFDKRSPQTKKRIARYIWRHMVTLGQEADAVISPSSHLAKSLKASGLHKRIWHIPNGFSEFKAGEQSLLAPDAGTKLTVLSVARLSGEKRVDILITALKRLKNVELVVVSGGPDEDKLQKLAIDNGVAGRVRFMGYLSNSAVRQLMREADVLAIASHGFENQPMVIIEALDAGLPIIYCDPNLEEGLGPENSLLVSRTAKGFAGGFMRLEDQRYKKAMALASKKIAKKYSASKMADKVLACYQEAIVAKNKA